MRVCSHCSAEFAARRRSHQYCSDACRCAARRGIRRVIPRTMTCHRCSVVFVPKLLTTRFCSRSCASKTQDRSGYPVNAGSFRPGHATVAKGRTPGFRHSVATRAAIRAAQLGDRGHNWQGGKSAPNELERVSGRYSEWRRAVFIRDDYACRSCGARSAPGLRVVLNADHIKPFAEFPELRFDIENGRTLCVCCHRATPTYGASRRKQARIHEAFVGGVAVLEAGGASFAEVEAERASDGGN